jgi:hypothetical protein
MNIGRHSFCHEMRGIRQNKWKMFFQDVLKMFSPCIYCRSLYKLLTESSQIQPTNTRQMQDIIIYKYKISNFTAAYREKTSSKQLKKEYSI